MSKRAPPFKAMSFFGIPLAFVIGLASGIYVISPQLGSSFATPAPPTSFQHEQVQVCFTPTMQCLPLIEKSSRDAKKSIYVQAYSLTSKAIANALIVAQQRGVKVVVIADRGQLNAKYSQIYPLKDAGISVWIDGVQGLQHNKVIIIDESTLICGSYNFSNAAENRNAENLLLISDSKLAQQYLKNWHNRKEQSRPL